MRNFYMTDYGQCYEKDLVYKLTKTCSNLEWFSVISGITDNLIYKLQTMYTVHEHTRTYRHTHNNTLFFIWC